jgi:uncharacterized protein (TIGR03790 family)
METGMTHRILSLLLALALVLPGLGSCGSAGQTGTGTAESPAPAQPQLKLPGLDQLDELVPLTQRSISSDRLELVGTTAIATSEGGVNQLPGSIDLDISAVSPAWAMYSAGGLEPGGAVVPSGLVTVFNKPMYVALANFSTGRWHWVKRNAPGTLPIVNGSELVSPGGRVYVVALAWQQSSNLSQLELLFSGEIPASPVVAISASDSIVSGYEYGYSASGSLAGSGALISGLSYDFGDGTEPVLGTDPDEVVLHTYAAAGDYTLSVRIDNDLGYSDTATLQLAVGPGNTELLVVCNSDIVDSLELADYYMSPITGRGIATTHRLELPLGSDVGPSIARAGYETEIRDPIKTFITGNNLTSSLKYILLLDGIPHQIPGADGGDYNLSSYSSVDSELCTLFSDGIYDHKSFLWNEDDWQNFQQFERRSASFFAGLSGLDAEYSFSHGQYKVTNAINAKYDLDYLVGRLDAYNLADAKALVDRSLAADTSGNGWVIYDTTPARFDLDTMTDPVWPLANTSGMSGEEVMAGAGFNYFIDKTTTRILGLEAEGMTPEAIANVICYAGWGVNHSGGSYPSGNEYILDDLQFTYLPGAAWISYESYNGTDFDSVDPDTDRSDIGRSGQGQICDFLHMGGSVAIGHVYEPWTIAVGDERAVFYRYAVKGDNWIEAAYKGLRCLSWMDVVVGDPLCRVK